MSDITPRGLRAGGKALWAGIADLTDLDVGQKAQLLEACRAKDRLDGLDEIIRARQPGWDEYLNKANTTANQMKQLLAALRLPDEYGKKPQRHGSARGAYASTGAVSLVDRLRAG